MFTVSATKPSDPVLNEKLLDEALGELEKSDVPGLSNPDWLSSLTSLVKSPDPSAPALTNADCPKKKLSSCASRLRELLPMPLPVFVALIFGAVGSACLGLPVFLALVAGVSVLVPFIYRLCMQKVARALKAYAEQEDRQMFGVDMHIGSVELSVCYGQLVINDFVVDNPEGFNSKYLWKANRIFVDLDMGELIKTRGQHVVVEDMRFDGLDAIIEYDSVLFGSAFGTSNFQKVLDFMHNKPAKATSAKQEKPPTTWTFEKVAFINVSADLASKAGEARFDCADLRYRHFSQEMDSQHFGELVSHLVIALNKTVLANLAGRSFAEKHL
eukprot:gb/GFBE01065415.1/.p1 GENE.gb/GFBE01065415.1/~~gb/GFBE01065415.1/.p1  ORF type:complete len:328 (+),score=96.20 gb/GFBE01065415.1/:1-984(+)